MRTLVIRGLTVAAYGAIGMAHRGEPVLFWCHLILALLAIWTHGRPVNLPREHGPTDDSGSKA